MNLQKTNTACIENEDQSNGELSSLLEQFSNLHYNISNTVETLEYSLNRLHFENKVEQSPQKANEAPIGLIDKYKYTISAFDKLAKQLETINIKLNKLI